MKLDVADPKSREAAGKHISDGTSGKLSVLVNKLGARLEMRSRRTADVDSRRGDPASPRSLTLTSIASARSSRSFRRPARARAALGSSWERGGGRRSVVVNVGSFTMQGAAWNGAYVSSKVSLHAGFAAETDRIRPRWAR